MARRPSPHAAIAVLATLGLALPADAGVRAGFEGGLNYGKLDYVAAPALFGESPSYRSAWCLGAVCEAPLTPHLSLVAGARYLEYGYQSSLAVYTTGGGYAYDLRTTWRYLGVPVLLEARQQRSRGPFLAGGFEAAYLLDVAERALVTPLAVRAAAVPAGRRAEPTGRIFESLSPTDPLDRYRRFDLALVAGAGWSIPFRGHTLLAEVRYHHGLLDVAKSGLVEERTRGLELLGGWRW